MASNDMSNKELKNHFEKKLNGGAYTHTEETLYELHDIQYDILRDMVKNYPAKMFKPQEINLMCKNTRNIFCETCGSDNVYVEYKQLRSADEATSKIYTCLKCNHVWRVG